MLVTLEIPSKDRSYPWFLEWMALHAPQHAAPAPDQPRGIAGLRALMSGKQPLSLRSHELAVETAFKQHENGSSEAVFNLVPGPGTHYFRYKNAWFQVSLSPPACCTRTQRVD
jgi:chaperone BCS1